MQFLKNLFSAKTKSPKNETAEAVFIYSQCDSCQETFCTRVDKQFDILMNYEDNGPAYRTHKELIGARCRTRILLDLEFDQHKRLSAQTIENGHFITRDEYEAGRPAASGKGEGFSG